LGWILQAASQDSYPILSCANFYFLLHYVITIHQRYRKQTDGQTEHHVRSIMCDVNTACRAFACCAKKEIVLRLSKGHWPLFSH